MRLIELSDLEIYILDQALEVADMDQSDLLTYDNLHVINIQKVSDLILEADISFKY